MIILIGSGGQLGLEMQKSLKNHGYSFKAYDYPEVDITKKDSIEKIIDKDTLAVINCAAYTDVDGAEGCYDKAHCVNALGPKYLAQLCYKKNIELIHISTDYVFNGESIIECGKSRAYCEADKCFPMTAYGKTKLEGEKYIQKYHDRYYILRTAWLYGDGNNFVNTMINLSKKTDEMKVVNDQIGSPTSTKELSKAIIAILGSGKYGVYHATCEGCCSWYDFAKKIFEIKKIDIRLTPCCSEEFKRPADRPKWSVLENMELKKIGINTFTDWESALVDYLSELEKEE